MLEQLATKGVSPGPGQGPKKSAVCALKRKGCRPNGHGPAAQATCNSLPVERKPSKNPKRTAKAKKEEGSGDSGGSNNGWRSSEWQQ